jgi:beta-lactamase regulating signal transducer with metallopeptidase domain
MVENQASAPRVSGIEQVAPVLMTNDHDARVISVLQSSKILSFETISLSHLLLAGWIAGVVIFLLPVAIGLWQIRSLRRAGLPWRRGQSLAGIIAPDAGVHRRVEVLLHETVPGPMTCGFVHPTIVLPQDAESWNDEDLNRAGSRAFLRRRSAEMLGSNRLCQPTGRTREASVHCSEIAAGGDGEPC